MIIRTTQHLHRIIVVNHLRVIDAMPFLSLSLLIRVVQ
jgi:hypothetical protein